MGDPLPRSPPCPCGPQSWPQKARGVKSDPRVPGQPDAQAPHGCPRPPCPPGPQPPPHTETHPRTGSWELTLALRAGTCPPPQSPGDTRQAAAPRHPAHRGAVSVETDLGIRVSREGVLLFLPTHLPASPASLRWRHSQSPALPLGPEGRSLPGARHSTQPSTGGRATTSLAGAQKSPTATRGHPLQGQERALSQEEQRTEAQETNFELPIFPLKLI